MSQSIFMDCDIPLFDASLAEVKTECCSHSGQNQNAEHEGESHQCSPFCTADCCSSPVSVACQIFIEEQVKDLDTVYFSHQNNYTYSYRIKPYNPPKI